MAQSKKPGGGLGDMPRIDIGLFLEEVKAHHLSKAIEWSGRELMSNPKIAEKITGLLMGESELTKIVLAIAVQSGIQPPIVHNNITTGFIMGIALALELLNERESLFGNVDEDDPKITPGPKTIQ